MRPSSRRQNLRIDGKTVNRVERLAHRLVKSGMGVDGVHHGFHGGFGFHGGHRFGDDLKPLGADDMDAEDFAVPLVGNHFDETVVMSQDSGAAVAGEGEAADLHLVTLGARLGLGQPHAADPRLGVGAAGDAVPVDGDGGLAGHVRYRDHAFHSGDMRQLRSARHHVADGVDARLGGLLVRVDLDEAAIQLHPGMFDPDVFGVGLAAHGHQQLFGFELFLLAVLGGEREADALAGLPDVLGAGAGFDADLLLAKDALEFLGDVLVFHGDDARQHLNDRHLGAEAVEDGSELDAHSAGADNDEALGNRGEVQDLDIGEDQIGVGREAGQHAGLRTGGHDDVPGLERLDAGIRLDFHLAIAFERGIAGDALDFGALEQHSHAVRVLVDDGILARLHLGVIEAGVLALYALLIRVDEALPDIGGVEQGLGGYAPDQEAGAAQAGLFFEERRLKTVLAGANGSGVAARATPDNNQIVGHLSHSCRRGARR